MAKKVWFLSLFFVASFLIFGCQHDPNRGEPHSVQAAPGGGYRLNLVCGEKLINVTWHGGSYLPWILTRPMRDGETPETYNWVEYTPEGQAKSSYIFVECSVKR
ncbi:MAG: hypothetical protein WC460_06485 [Patescibacteria group bacterium]